MAAAAAQVVLFGSEAAATKVAMGEGLSAGLISEHASEIDGDSPAPRSWEVAGAVASHEGEPPSASKEGGEGGAAPTAAPPPAAVEARSVVDATPACTVPPASVLAAAAAALPNVILEDTDSCETSSSSHVELGAPRRSPTHFGDMVALHGETLQAVLKMVTDLTGAGYVAIPLATTA